MITAWLFTVKKAVVTNTMAQTTTNVILLRQVLIE